MAASKPVAIASDQGPLGVRTGLAVITTTFTRPADTTAYAINDVVGPSAAAVQEFASAFRSNGNSGYVVRAQLFTDQSANVALFRLYLYSVTPSAIADNSPFTLLYANAANHIGYIDFPAMATEGAGSTAAVSLWSGQIAALAAGGDDKIFGVLVAKSVFTPASAQQFTLRLAVDQN